MNTTDVFDFTAKDTSDILSSFSEDTLEEVGFFTMKNTRKALKQMEEQKKEKLIPLTAPLTVNCYTAKVYHVEDIQEILEISRTAAYALIKKAPFRVVHIGNAIRISKEDFDRWLNHSEQRNGGL